jgi:hypothetical protein
MPLPVYSSTASKVSTNWRRRSGVTWQSDLCGMCAGLKSIGVPFPFEGNLRQKKTAGPPELDDQAMTPDLDVARARDRFDSPSGDN